MSQMKVQLKDGYFDNEKKEYVVTNMYPVKYLTNYLWNEETVCTCDHFGSGTSWFKIENSRRTIEAGERNFYVKDRATGEYYSATRNHDKRPFDTFETRWAWLSYRCFVV